MVDPRQRRYQPFAGVLLLVGLFAVHGAWTSDLPPPPSLAPRTPVPTPEPTPTAAPTLTPAQVRSQVIAYLRTGEPVDFVDAAPAQLAAGAIWPNVASAGRETT